MSGELEAQLRAIFREEAVELLGELRDQLARMADGELSGHDAPISTAMRLAHTLKGGAAQVGLTGVERAAHAMEDVFLRLRTAAPPEVGALLPLLADLLAAMDLATVGQGEAQLLALSEQLKQRVAAGDPRPAPQAATQPPRLGARSVAPTSGGSTKPAADVRADQSARPASRDSAPQVDVLALPAASDDARLRASSWPRPSRAPRGAPAPLTRELAEQRAKAGAGLNRLRTIRIETERLDRLIQLASELLAACSDLRSRHEVLRAVRADLDAKAYETASNRLDGLIQDNQRALSAFGRLSSDLGASMQRARMVRLQTLVPSLRSTLHDAARTLQKAIELETDLSEVELDKVVLDNLREPLMHVLRNAADHGIERPAERELQGKPRRGRVRVSAKVVGNAVQIEIADDGRGVDPRRVAAELFERDMISIDQFGRLDDAAIVDLIFAEGFSTAEQATRLSGRGVGLDIVRRSLYELGGSVRVVGHGPLGGALFVLTVPLSLLRTRVLLVSANQTVYALPVHAIERVMRAPRTALETLGGMEVVRVGEQDSLPLRWLSELLSARRARDWDQLRLLVVKPGARQVAIAVDEVLREEEVLVRNLPWNFAAVAGISGAAVLADGRAAIVIDMAELLACPHMAVSEGPRGPSTAKILVVDDSMTTRTVHRNALTSAGYSCLVAPDGNEAWELLRTEAIDVVVTDIQMPGMDGFELTARIRADARLQHLPVVLVTALDRPEDRQRGIEVGADDYVIKGPFERDALLAAVTKHVES